MRKLFSLVAWLIIPGSVIAQNDTVIFTELGNYNYPIFNSVFKPLFNRNGSPYLYAASKEYGFVTFDVNNMNSPVPVNTIGTTSFNSLKPTYVQQNNNTLYVGLGDFQGSDQEPGLATLDISNPAAPVILDQWDTTAWSHGVSSVTYANGYAYVCAMEDGLIILDVSNPNNIQFVSQFLPDTLFGNPPYSPTARNCEWRNDTLLLAFDAGGLRMLDVSIKSNPVEIGQYVNTSLTAVANAAYNEVEWVGNIAYVAVDYCGLDVVNVANPQNMYNIAWNNPWNCVGLNWVGSDGHANQLIYIPSSQILLASAGDSEIRAFNAHNPAQPAMIGAWGAMNDQGGAWGLDVYGNTVAVGRADNPINWPFAADTGGIQLLQWQFILDAQEMQSNVSQPAYPVPADDFVILPCGNSNEVTIEIFSYTGALVYTGKASQSSEGGFHISTAEFDSGMYTYRIVSGNQITHGKFAVAH